LNERVDRHQHFAEHHEPRISTRLGIIIDLTEVWLKDFDSMCDNRGPDSNETANRPSHLWNHFELRILIVLGITRPMKLWYHSSDSDSMRVTINCRPICKIMLRNPQPSVKRLLESCNVRKVDLRMNSQLSSGPEEVVMDIRWSDSWNITRSSVVSNSSNMSSSMRKAWKMSLSDVEELAEIWDLLLFRVSFLRSWIALSSTAVANRTWMNLLLKIDRFELAARYTDFPRNTPWARLSQSCSLELFSPCWI
jgi:hypothetical protein